MAIGLRKRILYVDNDAELLTNLTKHLEWMGRYQVTALGESREALRVAKSGRFDLVLTGCRMAGMDGWELAEAFDRDRRLRRLPFLMLLSAESRLSARARVEGLHEIDGIPTLWKPVKLSMLTTAMDRLILRTKKTEDPNTVLFLV